MLRKKPDHLAIAAGKQDGRTYITVVAIDSLRQVLIFGLSVYAIVHLDFDPALLKPLLAML